MLELKNIACPRERFHKPYEDYFILKSLVGFTELDIWSEQYKCSCGCIFIPVNEFQFKILNPEEFKDAE